MKKLLIIVIFAIMVLSSETYANNITVQQPFNSTGNLESFVDSLKNIPIQRILVGSVGFAYYLATIIGNGFKTLALMFNVSENYASVLGNVGAFIMIILLLTSLAVAIARLIKKSIKYALLIAIVIIIASIAFGLIFGG